MHSHQICCIHEVIEEGSRVWHHPWWSHVHGALDSSSALTFSPDVQCNCLQEVRMVEMGGFHGWKKVSKSPFIVTCYTKPSKKGGLTFAVERRFSATSFGPFCLFVEQHYLGDRSCQCHLYGLCPQPFFHKSSILLLPSQSYHSEAFNWRLFHDVFWIQC